MGLPSRSVRQRATPGAETAASGMGTLAKDSDCCQEGCRGDVDSLTTNDGAEPDASCTGTLTYEESDCCQGGCRGFKSLQPLQTDPAGNGPGRALTEVVRFGAREQGSRHRDVDTRLKGVRELGLDAGLLGTCRWRTRSAPRRSIASLRDSDTARSTSRAQALANACPSGDPRGGSCAPARSSRT